MKKLTTDWNRCLPKEDKQMVNTYIERYWPPLVIREIQTKTSVIYHNTPTQIAKFKRRIVIKGFQGYRTTRTLIHFWWEYCVVQPLRKTVGSFSKS